MREAGLIYITLSIVLMFFGLFLVHKSRNDDVPEKIVKLTPSKSLIANDFTMYIRVNMNSWNQGRYPLGSILIRRALLNTRDEVVSEQELLERTGFVMSDGRELDPEWDIVTEGVLKHTNFTENLPDLRGPIRHETN